MQGKTCKLTKLMVHAAKDTTVMFKWRNVFKTNINLGIKNRRNGLFVKEGSRESDDYLYNLSKIL